MKDNTFIIFSSDDWGWKTSKYQLSIRLARDNKVLFVSSVGFRAPTVSKQDFGRILKKLAGFFKGLQKVEPNLYVLTPLIIPFWRGGIVDRINYYLLKVQLAWARFKLNMASPYVFVFSQNWHDFVLFIKRMKLVYYCVDDQSGFSGIDAEKFKVNDQSLTEKADLVFCSSQLLFEQKRQINDQTYYLPHGVNYHLFATTVFDKTLKVAPDAVALRKPVLGFYGHISYDWVDVELLKYLATERSGWTILLLGRYSVKEDEFAAHPNIVYLGEKPFEDLPSYCKAMDVALIPFVKSQLTNNCNPLKLYEYLAAGLPVVSTDIPEVCSFDGDVRIAKNATEFLFACEYALKDGDVLRQQRSKKMAHSSWDDRIINIYHILEG